MDDWNGGGNFMNKPVRGWLHPDQKVADTGISYGVRYIGCMEVKESMKSLDFDTRSLIAKECINRLCEVAGLKTADKKRKVDKRLMKMLADKPNMDHAGANVSLTITSSYLSLVSMDTGDMIAHHEMPKISFASGGDADTMDFVSYVAKDECFGRACFVLECGGGLAQDVITTIGQAFELRYKQYIKKTPASSRNETDQQQASGHNGNLFLPRDDPEYYNDLPGKVPPDVIANTAFLDNATIQTTTKTMPHEANSNSQSCPSPYATTPLQKDFPDSLIDFSSNSNYVSVYRRPPPEYVNTTAVISGERNSDALTKQKTAMKHDIFDMQPFIASLPSETDPLDSLIDSPANETASIPLDPPIMPFSWSTNQKTPLAEEPWYHGPISRQESERLVARDGDFLVRESQATAGQYILTGMQRNSRKHLLLVDPEGVIRTKDQVFKSVSHLIKHHRDNSLPIISAESALLLRNPVMCSRSQPTASSSVQV